MLSALTFCGNRLRREPGCRGRAQEGRHRALTLGNSYPLMLAVKFPFKRENLRSLRSHSVAPHCPAVPPRRRYSKERVDWYTEQRVEPYTER